MPIQSIARHQWRPHIAISVTLLVVLTAAMGWLRLIHYRDQPLSLTYGLPLLLCLWYPSRPLLWSLVASFVSMAAYKAFVLLPGDMPAEFSPALHWSFQVVNLLSVAVVVHLVLRSLESLQVKNAQLEHSNQELIAREEEISRQNEELQAQTEELAQQNEEIQQQSEEVQQQAEELQAQTAELELANRALERRQALLENLLQSLQGIDEAGDAPRRACESVLTLLGDTAVSAAIVIRSGGELVVRGSTASRPVRSRCIPIGPTSGPASSFGSSSGPPARPHSFSRREGCTIGCSPRMPASKPRCGSAPWNCRNSSMSWSTSRIRSPTTCGRHCAQCTATPACSRRSASPP